MKGKFRNKKLQATLSPHPSTSPASTPPPPATQVVSEGMVYYANPIRQFVTITLICCAIPGTAIAIGLLLNSKELLLVTLFIGLGCMIWFVLRHVGASGIARLEADALHITPTFPSPCAPFGRICIRWAEIQGINTGYGGIGSRSYVQLKVRGMSGSLIISGCDKESRALPDAIADKAKEWQSNNPGSAPIQELDWFASPLWKGVAGLGIAVLVFGVIGTLWSGKAGEWKIWIQLLVIAGAVVPMAYRAFRRQG